MTEKARVTKLMRIRRDDGPDLQFRGVELGRGSDMTTSLTLYKTSSGKYVVSVSAGNAFSIIEGGKYTVLVAENLTAAIDQIGKTIGLFSPAVKSAFLEASDIEPTLRQLAIEELK